MSNARPKGAKVKPSQADSLAGIGAARIPDLSSSVPGDLTLGSLSDAQDRQLCLEINNFYDALGATLKEGTCARKGINAARSAMASSDAAARSACQSAQDACIVQSSRMSNITREAPDASCLTTVTDYGACLMDSSAVLTRQFSALPACQSLTAASLPSLGAGGAGPLPVSCTLVFQKCPQANAP
ncbi:MAG: hypothetical protein ABW061_05105 [Polyangiaceae bacterium]